MAKSVTESYPQLWHYTTAHGLNGILTSQQLWATNIFYLNDAEELIGFFDHKLIRLLEDGTREGIASASKTTEGLLNIEAAGGPEKVLQEVPINLLQILRTTTQKLQIYVTSFCFTSNENANDGLLSQWRGYGTHGGYAIVFDTLGLDELLREDQKQFLFSYTHWGDVDYFNTNTSHVVHEEVTEWEATIRKTVSLMIADRNLKPAEALFEPIISLATRHKHFGFREEAEVRISVVLPDDETVHEIRKTGNTLLEKSVYFTPRDGILIPHIALFERPASAVAKLPIKKIVIGPHHEKEKRKEAVELLLKKLEITAEVSVSNIPYIGR